MTLPLLVGGCRCLVKTWVVAGDFPLLLSRKTMAFLGAVLEVNGGVMTVGALDVVVRLTASSVGNLTFNALAPGMGAPAVVDISDTAPLQSMAVLTKHTPGLDRAVAIMHTQYGHSSAPRLHALLRQAKVTDGEVFAAVTAAVNGWDACARTGPRPSRPFVSIPRALKFSDAVAVDLVEVAPLGRFLHIVDLGTPFSKAVAIPNKETVTVSRAPLSGWLVHRGPPRAALLDPGGEFDSALWRTLAEHHNITVYSTAAQAHFSNGAVERHNQKLKTMVARLRVDHPGADLQELFDLACLAKNVLGNTTAERRMS